MSGGTLNNEPPKSPWGGGSGGGNGDGGNGGGPRNPWSLPPEGRRGRPGGGGGGNGGGNGGGPFDDFLKRARGGGFPGLPTGGARTWLFVAGGLITAWLLYTSIHVIGPQERGVSTLFGRYWSTMSPGVNMTLPSPLMSVQVFDVQNIRTESFPENSGENLMLTGDRNIVDLSYSVRWDISDAPDFAFQIAAPRDTVRATAETAMRAVIATATLNDTIGAGRSQLEARVQELMQQILNEYHSGVRVQGVAIKNASAPQAVDEDFKKVTAAQQEAQANKNNANAYAQQILAAAQGETAEFDKIYEQYRLAPEVTRMRLYYETMEAVLARTNKTIVESGGVTPYLPLPGLRPSTSGTAQQAQPAQPAQPAKPEGGR
nr:protease modulator HflK [Sphingomonas canadensis]